MTCCQKQTILHFAGSSLASSSTKEGSSLVDQMNNSNSEGSFNRNNMSQNLSSKISYSYLKLSSLTTRGFIFSIIKMKQSPQDLIHKSNKCFSWWINFMTKTYGPDLKWFSIIAPKKDALKIKAFDFKQSIAKILLNTEHAKCFNRIVSFFPKNQRNQIQFGIFLNTIKVSSKSLSKQSSFTKRSRSKISKTEAHSFSISSQKIRINSNTNQTFYISDQSNTWQNDYQNDKRQNLFIAAKLSTNNFSRSFTGSNSITMKNRTPRRLSKTKTGMLRTKQERIHSQR